MTRKTVLSCKGGKERRAFLMIIPPSFEGLSPCCLALFVISGVLLCVRLQRDAFGGDSRVELETRPPLVRLVKSNVRASPEHTCDSSWPQGEDFRVKFRGVEERPSVKIRGFRLKKLIYAGVTKS